MQLHCTVVAKQEGTADEQLATQLAVIWGAAQCRGIPVPVPVELCVGKRARRHAFSGPSPFFVFFYCKGLCFSLWFSLYVGLALEAHKNPKCLKGIETRGSPSFPLWESR